MLTCNVREEVKYFHIAWPDIDVVEVRRRSRANDKPLALSDLDIGTMLEAGPASGSHSAYDCMILDARFMTLLYHCMSERTDCIHQTWVT